MSIILFGKILLNKKDGDTVISEVLQEFSTNTYTKEIPDVNPYGSSKHDYNSYSVNSIRLTVPYNNKTEAELRKNSSLQVNISNGIYDILLHHIDFNKRYIEFTLKFSGYEDNIISKTQNYSDSSSFNSFGI